MVHRCDVALNPSGKGQILPILNVIAITIMSMMTISLPFLWLIKN